MTDTHVVSALKEKQVLGGNVPKPLPCTAEALG